MRGWVGGWVGGLAGEGVGVGGSCCSSGTSAPFGIPESHTCISFPEVPSLNSAITDNISHV